ncbi:MAG: class I SAM-dependent methyltransferase [Chitinophagales bacterium]
MNFQDHFSKQSDIYAKARPTYPEELFTYLAALVAEKELCWDCGTGNGQAAVALAQYFKKVIATDPSARQIENAVRHSNIEYRVATAEESGLPDKSVNLLTAATAAHWFQHDKFYNEARRVVKKDGVIALWTYSMAHITPEIDELMNWFAYDYLEKYWPDGRWYVRNHYKTLPFPFDAMETPAFYCKMQWSLAQWLDYVRSWSSYTRYVQQHATDPLTILMPKLEPLWPTDEIKLVTWPLHLKCARITH